MYFESTANSNTGYNYIMFILNIKRNKVISSILLYQMYLYYVLLLLYC